MSRLRLVAGGATLAAALGVPLSCAGPAHQIRMPTTTAGPQAGLPPTVLDQQLGGIDATPTLRSVLMADRPTVVLAVDSNCRRCPDLLTDLLAVATTDPAVSLLLIGTPTVPPELRTRASQLGVTSYITERWIGEPGDEPTLVGVSPDGSLLGSAPVGDQGAQALLDAALGRSDG